MAVFEALAKGVESTYTLLAGLSYPFLQPGFALGAPFEAAGMGQEPQSNEVSEDALTEHLLQVELDIGRPGKAGVVPEDSELAPV